MAEEVAEKPSENFDAIRNQMDHTRSSLADKLEALECKVRNTVDSTKHKVEETVQATKDSVQETIQTVKRTFDLKYQVSQHPWLMVGCSLFSGVVLGHLLAPKRRSQGNGGDHGDYDEGYRHRAIGEFSEGQEWRSVPEATAGRSRPSFMSRVFGQFEDELCKLQSIAIGAGLGVVRDWVSKTMPSLAPKLNDVFDSATSKLGGERIEGPVLRSSDDETT